MAHALWCGEGCCDCAHPCTLDESMPCSPDCEKLKEDGSFSAACVTCEVFQLYIHDLIGGAANGYAT